MDRGAACRVNVGVFGCVLVQETEANNTGKMLMVGWKATKLEVIQVIRYTTVQFMY